MHRPASTDTLRLLRTRRQHFDRVLLIVTRRIGDVLLSTPLLRSLRQAYPQATIDVMVYRGVGAILHGNPDIDALVEVSERPGRTEYLDLLRRIRRRYDLAVSVQAGDRPYLYAMLAARTRVCLMPDLKTRSLWKRWVVQGWALLDDINTHTVDQNLALATVLGIEPVRELVPPRPDAPLDLPGLLGFDPLVQDMVVVHPSPRWPYKQWTREGWERLIDGLLERGFRVVVTGGPDAEERVFCADLAARDPCRISDIAAQLPFAAVAEVLRHAAAFVGPDTALTHLAAAVGIPTLALFGPSNPVKWGPWPQDYDGAGPPFRMFSPVVQVVGNVGLLQPNFVDGCVPCREEGCERHRMSRSACLDGLDAALVLQALEQLLRERVA
jgi:heptosyltransferase-3